MNKNDDIELQELEQSLLSNDEDNTSQSQQEYVKTVVYKGKEIKILTKDWRHSPKLKAQILLSFYLFIVLGLSDQTIGSLMPSLLKHYETTQPVLSAIFILQFSGYAVSAISNNMIHVKLGRGGVLLIATGLHITTSFIESTRPPLLLFMIVYFFYGLGIGLLDSGLNVYLSSLVDHNEIMGFLHGFYGVGSVIGPPMASIILKLVNKGDDSKGGFGLHYFILGCMSLIGGVCSFFFFRDEDSLKYEYSVMVEAHENDDDLQFDDDDDNDNGGKEVSTFKLLKNKLILVFSGYLFLYVGTEVAIGTWLLSYLIKVKQMDQITASFNVSWFWIGLTIGRMGLGFVTKFFKNEFRANFWYSFISLVCFMGYTAFLLPFSPSSLGETWFSLINKLLVFISGVFVGPLFPTSNVALMKILPQKLHVAAIGIYSSIGGSGSAILPYLIGLLIHWTDFYFFPIFITISIAGYVLNWWIIPRICKVDYDF